MTIVGGNLADIAANESSLRMTAEMAVKTGSDTSTAATALHTAVIDATDELVRRFGEIAGQLSADIERSARQLEATDWHGTSREQALVIEGDLKTQVGQLLKTATEGLTNEQRAFCARADALVGEIQGRFTTVMESVQTEYSALGAAARITMERFEAADQTIRTA